MQIYIDESGNIVSALKAPCFVLAALVLREDDSIKRCIKDIRRNKIKKMYRKTSELKFSTSDHPIKRRVLVPLLAMFSTFLDACQKLLSYCLSASRIPGKLNWKGH